MEHLFIWYPMVSDPWRRLAGWLVKNNYKSLKLEEKLILLGPNIIEISLFTTIVKPKQNTKHSIYKNRNKVLTTLLQIQYAIKSYMTIEGHIAIYTYKMPILGEMVSTYHCLLNI